jgi:hypothetical protein
MCGSLNCTAVLYLFVISVRRYPYRIITVLRLGYSVNYINFGAWQEHVASRIQMAASTSLHKATNFLTISSSTLMMRSSRQPPYSAVEVPISGVCTVHEPKQALILDARWDTWSSSSIRTFGLKSVLGRRRLDQSHQTICTRPCLDAWNLQGTKALLKAVVERTIFAYKILALTNRWPVAVPLADLSWIHVGLCPAASALHPVLIVFYPTISPRLCDRPLRLQHP